jgi:hypothetical protein
VDASDVSHIVPGPVSSCGHNPVPAGFTLKAESSLCGTLLIDAVNPNEKFPKPHHAPGIVLRISWQSNSMEDMILDMLAKTPEEPAAQVPGSVSREEPSGISAYRKGVLTCRKVITPWVGSGEGPDLVTFRISWTGKGQDGPATNTVNQFHGSKESAIAWIDAIIPKIITPK